MVHAQPRLLEALAAEGSSTTALGLHDWSKPRVALTTWETSELPLHFFAALDGGYDHVIVPSTFCAEAIAGDDCTTCDKHWTVAKKVTGALDVIVIPHCFDPSFWNPGRIELGGARFKHPAGTRFYSSGAWGERKNPLGVLKAYLGEFSKADAVHLTMHIEGCDFGEVRSLIARSGLMPQQLPGLTVPDRTELSEFDMLCLHAENDVFVSATRGEGWGLGMFEAACMGKCVIAPSLGGQREFLAEYNGFLEVDHSLTPCFGTETRGAVVNGVQTSRVSIPPGLTCRQLWAEPDLAQLARWMRRTHQTPWFQGTKAAIADRAQLESYYSYDNVGDMFHKALQEMIK